MRLQLALGLRHDFVFIFSLDDETASEPKPSSTQRDGKLEVPFVPFDVDLEYWEKPDEMEAPNIVK